MLQIQCPYCGLRDEIEFRWSGEAHVERPGPPEAVSDERWAEYLFMRKNLKGVHRERWLHAAGCQQWFNLARDTVSHRIVATYRLCDSPPGNR